MNLLTPLACGLLLLVLLSGCATIDTTTTSTHGPDYRNAGTIAVVASVATVNNSAEFSRYKARIESKLAANGYTIVTSPPEASSIALVAYGMDVGQIGFVSTPLFSPATNRYPMPSYGAIGASSPSVSSYTRAIALDIVDTASLKEGKPRKVLELRAKSVGSSRSISCVFDDMLDAMFMDFPGVSGKEKSVTLLYNGDC
jgi:hypothetical protein